MRKRRVLSAESSSPCKLILRWLIFGFAPATLVLHHTTSGRGRTVMRVAFPSIVVFSAIFLAPSAHGNTLELGPAGSVPTDKSFFLTLDPNGSGDSRSYIVDRKGFYERDSWSKSSSTWIGSFREGEGSNKGFSSTNLSVNSFNSKGANGGTDWSFSGGAGFSGGASNGAGFAGGKGSGLALSEGLILSDSGLNGPFSLGSEGAGGKGVGDPPGVSATPLPASWTLMLAGLAFGLLVWFRKSRSSAKRKRERPLAAA